MEFFDWGSFSILLITIGGMSVAVGIICGME
jgi:hypothetical protein